jgi:7-cyano-7-deazaguanine reductase
MKRQALTHLGRQSQEPITQLETVPWTHGAAVVTLHCAEFTSHCPVTHQPDFGQLTISYAPKRALVETKSLKLFLWSFRERQAFNEELVHQIAQLFYAQVAPQWVEVAGRFNQRGGISVEARVRYPRGRHV